MTTAPPVQDLVRFNKVSVTFDRDTQPIIGSLSLPIQKGSFTSLIGPSGCGKSTLLRLLAGLITPTTGQLEWEGSPETSFVFQEPRLLPWRTTAANIWLPQELKGAKFDRSRIETIAQLVGLSHADLDKFPRMLSGGMQMRVALARALITQPDLLLLDEPFAALDELLREQLNVELLNIWKQLGCTIVFVTHHISEAVFLSQQVLVMQPHPGRITTRIPISQPYPRSLNLRSTSEFVTACSQLSEELRGGAT